MNGNQVTNEELERRISRLSEYVYKLSDRLHRAYLLLVGLAALILSDHAGLSALFQILGK